MSTFFLFLFLFFSFVFLFVFFFFFLSIFFFFFLRNRRPPEFTLFPTPPPFRSPVDKALEILTFSPKKAAAIIKKVLESAIANAENNEGADIDELSVATIYVDEGPTQKRMRARAKGRGNRILKRSSHVTVIVSDN